MSMVNVYIEVRRRGALNFFYWRAIAVEQKYSYQTMILNARQQAWNSGFETRAATFDVRQTNNI